jgi:hypothetical protein
MPVFRRRAGLLPEKGCLSSEVVMGQLNIGLLKISLGPALDLFTWKKSGSVRLRRPEGTEAGLLQVTWQK